MSHTPYDECKNIYQSTSAENSRRTFCKTALAGGTALAFGQGVDHVYASEPVCNISRPEQAFANSFVNVPDSYGPTRVNFSDPLPEGLRGTLYRNGPARMSRGDTRYNHWFDGDGMVHAFSLHEQELVHQGRMVDTKRSMAEEKAGRFLWGGFGTGLKDSQSVSHPNDLNVDNTSVLPVGDEVLALWEAGSPYRIHAETLETLGRHVFSPETDGLPFSAHPRIDPQGKIWNFGYMSGTGKLVLYELNSDGTLNRTSLIDAPNADMVHDFAITDQYLVFLLVPLHFNPNSDPTKPFMDALSWDAQGAVEVLVIDKENLSIVHQFQLPPFFAFHFGNAWQDGNNIRIEVATSTNFHPLMNAITLAMRGERSSDAQSSAQAVEIHLDLTSKRASIESLPTQGADFPRFDQRFTGQRTDQLFMLAQSEEMPKGMLGFNTITALNRKTDTENQFSYGAQTLAEEHVFVPKPGAAAGVGWLVGTSYDWQQCRTTLSVFDAEYIQDGPISQAHLPYSLPMGLHGQFVAA